MGYLIALEDVTPPARSDERPWVTATIEEAEAMEGPWSALETIPLDPPDPDPAHPIARSLSTSLGTLISGWYRLSLDDGAGGTYAMNPVRLAKVWTPTEADVAAYIRARTKIPGGGEAGTFTENTRPTAVQVRRLIDQAVRRVSSKLQGIEPCTDELRQDANACAAIYAAMLVEQAYFPEQTTAAGSSFKSLEALWKDQIRDLATAVANTCGTAEGDSDPLAAGSFNDGYALIGRDYPPRW